MKRHRVMTSAWTLLSGSIASAASSTLLIRIASMGLTFVSAVFAARTLGVRNYGIYATVIAITTVLANVALLGLGHLSVWELAQSKATKSWSRIRSYLFSSRIIGLTSSISLGTFFSLVTFNGWLDGSFKLSSDLAVGGLLVPSFAMLMLFQDQTRGLGAVVLAQFPSGVIRPTILMVAFLGLYFWSTSITSFFAVVITIGATGLALIAAGGFLSRSVPAPARAANTAGTHGYFSKAVPFFVISLVLILQAQLQTMLLAWLAGPEQAALFQPIASVTPIMVIGQEALAMPIAPRVAHLWALGDMEQLKRVTRLATLASTGVTAGVIACVLLLGPWVLHAFGHEFVAAAPALWPIAIAQLANAATGQTSLLLSMTKHQYDTIVGESLNVLVAAVVGAILIRSWGAYGGAVALAVGIVVANVSALIFVRRRLDFNPSLPSAMKMLLNVREAHVTSSRRDLQNK